MMLLASSMVCWKRLVSSFVGQTSTASNPEMKEGTIKKFKDYGERKLLDKGVNDV